jgi:hypothetical protein
MTYSEKFGFSYFEKLQNECNVIEMFYFLLLKADLQANPWIFSDNAQPANNRKNS